MKVICADAGYEVLDHLFSQIEQNNYKATPQMLDEANNAFNALAPCCDIEEIAARAEALNHLCEKAVS